jgi:hypothetical protein
VKSRKEIFATFFSHWQFWLLLHGIWEDVKIFMLEMCVYIYIYTSCTRPRVAVAHSGEMEEKEERGSARFKYV